MSCMPEIIVTGRKTLSISKAAKRLRRFLRQNEPPEAVADPSDPDDANRSSSAELVCGIPDETLFQLEQICEALETKRKRRATMAGLPIAPFPFAQDEVKAIETPKKKSKKRSREDDQASARTDVKEPVQDDKSEKTQKKKRRKSAAI